MASELQRDHGRPASSVARTGGVDCDRPADPDVSPSEVLELLGDEHTRNVLRAVSERPRSGSEVAEAASISKPTAYRRLNRLEDAGLVATKTVLDPNGNHHKQFSAVLEGLVLELGEELSVAIDVTPPDRTPSGRGVLESP